MYRPFFLLLFFTALFIIRIEAQVYIDPTNIADENQDGTLEHPYSSWQMVNIQSNGSYLMRRGTESDFVEFALVANGKENVFLGSYGDGMLPDSRLTLRIDNCINFRVENLSMADANFDYCNNILINNCIIYGGGEGVETDYCTNVRIFNTEIYNMDTDAMFTGDVRNMEIGYCYVHDVNQEYNYGDINAGGDGFQFVEPFTDIHIHHIYMDRTSSGNKFGIIVSGEAEDSRNCLVENCIFAGPTKDDPLERGASVHMGVWDLVFRNCIFEDTRIGVFNVMPKNEIYNCVFEGLDLGVSTGMADSLVRIYNSTFYNNIQAVSMGYSDMRNNYAFLASASHIGFQQAEGIMQNNYQNVKGTGYDNRIGLLEPQFVDAANFDFHLKETSPLIDKGVQVDKVQLDFDGNTVPNGNAPDIGAFEQYDNNYNRRPVIKYTADTVYMSPGGSVILDGDESFDADGNKLYYYWTCPNDSFKFVNRYARYPRIINQKGTHGQVYRIAYAIRDEHYVFSKTKYLYIVLKNGHLQGPVTVDTTIINNPTFEPIAVSVSHPVETLSPLPYIDVFPNPASGSINFVVRSNSNYFNKYQVFDIMGKQVKQGEFSGNFKHIDLTGYKKGIYFLKVMGNTPRTLGCRFVLL
ncbi:MAG: T9SS type A sorting domain-containing protein [Bacteroidales bacterium]|nr:T9SS type A sorting domain-containing protein [Bacteroidales bacterium]